MRCYNAVTYCFGCLDVGLVFWFVLLAAIWCAGVLLCLGVFVFGVLI